MSKKILGKKSAAAKPSKSGKVTLHPASPKPAEKPKVKFTGHKLPRPYHGLQINVCKNPQCDNYGVEPKYPRSRARGTSVGIGDYKIIGTSEGFDKQLYCLLCNESTTLRSNKAAFEEIERISGYLNYKPAPISCPTESCPQHGISVSRSKGRQVLYGKTNAGTQRYKCLECGKVFSGRRKRSQQAETSAKHRELFMGLVNQVSIRRALEMSGVGVAAYYRSLKYFYQQCRDFVGQRESRLLNPSFAWPKMYLTTDRQSYTVNWTTIRQRKNVVLNAIASVELKTGYSFGMNVNFDNTVDAREVEDAATRGDRGGFASYSSRTLDVLSLQYASKRAHICDLRPYQANLFTKLNKLCPLSSQQGHSARFENTRRP